MKIPEYTMKEYFALLYKHGLSQNKAALHFLNEEAKGNIVCTPTRKVITKQDTLEPHENKRNLPIYTLKELEKMEKQFEQDDEKILRLVQMAKELVKY